MDVEFHQLTDVQLHLTLAAAMQMNIFPTTYAWSKGEGWGISESGLQGGPFRPTKDLADNMRVHMWLVNNVFSVVDSPRGVVGVHYYNERGIHQSLGRQDVGNPLRAKCELALAVALLKGNVVLAQLETLMITLTDFDADRWRSFTDSVEIWLKKDAAMLEHCALGNSSWMGNEGHGVSNSTVNQSGDVAESNS